VGLTAFAVQDAHFLFTSTGQQWLVVAGARAQFTGLGKINGAGDFGFLLTALDGAVSGGGGVDRFRIKIWDRMNPADPSDDVVVYDNQFGAPDGADPTAPLGAGSIAIIKR